MKEVPLRKEAGAPIQPLPEVRARPEAPHTVLPAGALHPVVPTAAAAVVAEALAVAAADAQVVVADNDKQSGLSLKHRGVSAGDSLFNAHPIILVI